MAFDDYESSQYEGKPVLCFRISRGDRIWLYTSAEEEITLPVGTFQPFAAIDVSEQEFSGEDTNATVEIELPRTSPIVEEYIAFPPASPTTVIIYIAHRGDEASALMAFWGEILDVQFEESGSIAKVTCVSYSRGRARRIPGIAYSVQCNWALYSTPCGVVAGDYRQSITVTTIDGADVVSADFALQPDGWYRCGFLERANGQRRFIVEHIGDRVTLMHAFQGLASLEVVDAYPGCDHTCDACDGKFDNLLNALALEHIPSRNPYEQRMV